MEAQERQAAERLWVTQVSGPGPWEGPERAQQTASTSLALLRLTQ